MTATSNSLNLDKICRTCLSDGEMLSIYSICHTDTIIEIIKLCTYIKLSENELFPTQICSKCVGEVDRMYKFKQLCETSETTLLKYVQNLEMAKLKTEDKENASEQLDLSLNEGSQVDENIIKKEDEDDFDTISKITVKLKLKRGRKQCLNVEKTLVKRKKRLKYECKLCNIMFGTKKELLEHRKNVNHPSTRLYTCGICSKTIPGGQVKSHMKLHRAEKLHPCSSCGRKFNSTYNLRRHMLTHTGERPFRCEVCNKSFTRSNYLNDHRKLHCEEKYYVCSFCGKSFSACDKLQSHLTVHDTKDNKCEVCSEVYASADLLLQHLKTHEFEGTLLCKLCGKRFLGIRPFKMHMKKHADKNGETHVDQSYRHVCKFCQRAFQSRATLNNHLLTHGEKSFLCSDCGKGFVSLPQLQTHMRTHTGLKPYKCKQCAKSFAQRSGLNTHLLIHTGVKPYVCTICDKSFTQSHHRKRHMLIHSGERPYKCAMCDKSFAQKENFVVHVRVHTGETPYTCSVCNKGFYDSSSLNKHKKSHNK